MVDILRGLGLIVLETLLLDEAGELRGWAWREYQVSQVVMFRHQALLTLNLEY